MPIDSLPHVDEHSTLIAADTGRVWPHLTDVVERSFSRPGMSEYARLVSAPTPPPSPAAPTPAAPTPARSIMELWWCAKGYRATKVGTTSP
ncbi:hypothetical protein AB0A95_23310 [Micromonospora sp. NPDC049230]|uniref:hypothetical protein n=1 Tax=Micromonospora sp. NPDC049230 TaxID=3155502 RepID=UPI0033E5822E